MSVTTTTREARSPFSTLVANLANLGMGQDIVTGFQTSTLRVANNGAEWVIAKLDDDMLPERVVYIVNELGMDQWEVQSVTNGDLVAKGAYDQLTAALARALVALG